MTSLLSSATLSQLSSKVEPLKYQPSQLSAGIVHIGIGAFHRAHQATYTHELLSLGETHWKITAVSLRSANIKQLMAPQDCLYTVIERSNDNDKVSLVGAIDTVLVAPENPQKVIDEIAKPSTKVVTLTVTEKGYCRDKTGQHLATDNPIIQDDLTNLAAPKSVPGFIVAACQLRQKNNDKLTIISCDNLPSNGDVTKTIVMEFAALVDQQTGDGQLSQWISENVSFCNSMVDRIVPATTAEDIELATNIIGLEDKSVVITEPFKQWVIEDNFVNDRPAWDKVGALFVKDVSAYEEMKLRLLNGAHSTLAYIGHMLGHEYIHQAVNDPNCLAFVRLLHREVLTTLADIKGIDLEAYADTILARFANQRVPYKTMQVASDGSQKLSQRLLEPAKTIAQCGKVSQPITFVIAVWCRFLEQKDDAGKAFTVIDPMSEQLVALATAPENDEKHQVVSILRESGICSDELLINEDFINTIALHLTTIHEQGVNQSLEAFLEVN